MKIDLNPIGYGDRRLSARSTKMKTSIITIAYNDSSIPDFRENSQRTLKKRVKIRSSRACCRYLGEQPPRTTLQADPTGALEDRGSAHVLPLNKAVKALEKVPQGRVGKTVSQSELKCTSRSQASDIDPHRWPGHRAGLTKGAFQPSL
jgi:hypothetical protein